MRTGLLIVAVLGGTLASLQAAIVSSGRISFAMGRDRVFPKFFDSVHPRWRTPWNATILLGLLNVVFLWGTTLFSSIGGVSAATVDRPRIDSQVSVVDPATYVELPERHVGELLLRGTSVTPGYYKRPDATAAIPPSAPSRRCASR